MRNIGRTHQCGSLPPKTVTLHHWKSSGCSSGNDQWSTDVRDELSGGFTRCRWQLVPTLDTHHSSMCSVHVPFRARFDKSGILLVPMEPEGTQSDVRCTRNFVPLRTCEVGSSGGHWCQGANLGCLRNCSDPCECVAYDGSQRGPVAKSSKNLGPDLCGL